MRLDDGQGVTLRPLSDGSLAAFWDGEPPKIASLIRTWAWFIRERREVPG